MTMIAELPNLIRARRRELGLSQAELARKASVSRTTLSHVEQGKASHAQLNVLARIMAAVDLSPRLTGRSGPDADRLLVRMQHKARLQAQRERHLRLALELATDAEVARGRIAGARKVVELWRENGACSPYYVERWTKLLALPPAQLAREMASLGEWEDAMFQNSPWTWN